MTSSRRSPLRVQHGGGTDGVEYVLDLALRGTVVQRDEDRADGPDGEHGHHEVGIAREPDGHPFPGLHAGVHQTRAASCATSVLASPTVTVRSMVHRRSRSSAKGWSAKRLARFSLLGMVRPLRPGWVVPYTISVRSKAGSEHDGRHHEWLTASGRGASSPPFPNSSPAGSRPTPTASTSTWVASSSRRARSWRPRLASAGHSMRWGPNSTTGWPRWSRTHRWHCWPGPAPCARDGSRSR